MIHQVSRKLITAFCVVVFLPLLSFAQEFKVGVILSLTGPALEYGEAMRNGLTLAQEEQPHMFSTIKFIYEDSKNDAQTAVTAFKKLQTADKVNLIYVFGVAACRALAPLAEGEKVPTILGCMDREAPIGKKYVLRFANEAADYIKVLVEHLQANNLKKIGLVMTEAPYLENLVKELEMGSFGGVTVTKVAGFQQSDNDFRPTITKLRVGKFDVIAVYLSGGQIAPFYRQANEQKLHLPTFGSNYFESHGEIVAAAGAMEGAVFSGNSVKQEFIDGYEKRFGMVSQMGWAALAYEFGLLTGELFWANHPKTAEEVLARFESIPRRNGKAVGEFYLVDSQMRGKYFEFPLTVKRIKDGKVIEVGK